MLVVHAPLLEAMWCILATLHKLLLILRLRTTHGLLVVLAPLCTAWVGSRRGHTLARRSTS